MKFSSQVTVSSNRITRLASSLYPIISGYWLVLTMGKTRELSRSAAIFQEPCHLSSTICCFGDGLVTPFFPSWWNTTLPWHSYKGNFPWLISFTFVSTPSTMTLSAWLCRQVYRSFRPNGWADGMWRRVPYCPHWHLSSSDTFHRTRFAGDGSISYVDFTRKLSRASLHAHNSIQDNFLSTKYSSHLTHCPLLVTLHEMKIASLTLTALYFIYHCNPSLFCTLSGGI